MFAFYQLTGLCFFMEAFCCNVIGTVSRTLKEKQNHDVDHVTGHVTQAPHMISSRVNQRNGRSETKFFHRFIEPFLTTSKAA